MNLRYSIYSHSIMSIIFVADVDGKKLAFNKWSVRIQIISNCAHRFISNKYD